jgi:hypothetical protein
MKHPCLLNIITLAILEICLLNSNLITLVTHEKYTHHIELPYYLTELSQVPKWQFLVMS